MSLFNGIKTGLKDPEFQVLGLLTIIILIVGTFFYSWVEHWRILDAFYFSVVTLATVGFGDFTPKTDIGKIFTVGYIFVGVGTLVSFITLLATKRSQSSQLGKRLRKKSEI